MQRRHGNDRDSTIDYPNYFECDSSTDDDENAKPVIILIGDNPLELTVGGIFKEPGYLASDSEDGSLTNDVYIGGDIIDPNTIGTCIRTYNVTDTLGSRADEVPRTIHVNPAQ